MAACLYNIFQSQSAVFLLADDRNFDWRGNIRVILKESLFFFERCCECITFVKQWQINLVLLLI